MAREYVNICSVWKWVEKMLSLFLKMKTDFDSD